MGAFRKKLVDAVNLFTFHDITLLPCWSEIESTDVDLTSKVSKDIEIAVPFVSSPMESVTGPTLAVAMARIGGLGVLHRNCSADEQHVMAQQVKTTPVDFKQWPRATLDENEQLVVGAAIDPQDLERAKTLAKTVDLLVMDATHFHTRSCFSGTRRLLEACSVDVVVGNLGTFESAEDVLSQIDGIAGLRCGIGSGSTATTSIQTRVSAPTLFAVASAADATRTLGMEIPIIADGGIRNPGDAALALAAGAWTVMLGNILAGTEESPGPTKIIQGQTYKHHYGMSSYQARKRQFRSDDLVEGVEGLVPVQGSVEEVINSFTSALQASCGYIGANGIPGMWERARFGRVSGAGNQELRSHSLLQVQKNTEK